MGTWHEDPWLIFGASITKSGPAEPTTHHHAVTSGQPRLLSGHKLAVPEQRGAKKLSDIKVCTCSAYFHGGFKKTKIRLPDTSHFSLAGTMPSTTLPLTHHPAQR